MKISRLMSHSIVTLGLLGISIGGIYSTTNASADSTYENPAESNPLHRETNKDKDPSSATSNAQVNVTDGYLTLDAVPNFNFGNNQDEVNGENKTKLGLTDNDGPSSKGNNDGLLRVTDHRTKSDNKWQLNVSLNNFYKIDNGKDIASPDSWSINLNQNKLTNDEENNNLPGLFNPELQNKRNESDNSKTVMSTQGNGNEGYGSTKVYYKTSDAQLNIPYNVKPGRYTADMNWSLTANAGSEVNEIKQ